MATLTFKSFSIDSTTLPQVSVDRLLALGFSAAIQNAVAGTKQAMQKAGKTKDEIDNAVAEAQQKKYEAILAGEWRAERGEGAQADPLTAMIAKVGREALLAVAKAKGIKLPKADSDAYAKLYDMAHARFADQWKAEAQRRLDLASSSVADIMAEFEPSAE